MPTHYEDTFGCTRRYIIVRMSTMSLGKGPFEVLTRTRANNSAYLTPEFDKKVAQFNNLEDAVKFVRIKEGNNVRQEE